MSRPPPPQPESSAQKGEEPIQQPRRPSGSSTGTITPQPTPMETEDPAAKPFTTPRKTTKWRKLILDPPVTKTKNTYDRLSDLSDTESEEETGPSTSKQIKKKTRMTVKPKSAAKSVKPPPIIIQGRLNKHKDLLTQIKQVVQKGFELRYAKNSVIIYCNEKADWENLKRSLDHEQAPYHTYTPSTEKTHAFVLRGIDGGVSTEEIKEALDEEYKIKAKNVFLMKKTIRPLYLVILDSTYTTRKLNNIAKTLNNVRVRWEDRRNQRIMIQCRRCQAWGHSSSNCHKRYRCSKCAEKHGITSCQSKDVKCANCGGKHRSFYEECPVYLYKLTQLPTTQVEEAKQYKPAPLPVNPAWHARKINEARAVPPPSARPANSASASASALPIPGASSYDRNFPAMPRSRTEAPSPNDGTESRWYLETEFPSKWKTVIYHIPKVFLREGQKQGCLAEEMVFKRLRDLSTLEIDNLWIIFFHSACYGGYSNRNQRLGKLMIRENDFVIFVKHKEKQFVLLAEVKSTHDKATFKTNLEVIADSKSIKNNKRSAQHQLRDHLEILENDLGYDISQETQCYIMWPFLGQYTKDPAQKIIKRWSEDKNLHVFEDTIANQESFNAWFANEVLTQKSCSERTFAHLLTRYIVLSCGIFMDEIHKDLLALLTQEQLSVITSTTCRKGGALVVHGIAGTGKTLLVLKKLQLLHENGQLDENNRALYICYWPGIRCDVQQKLKQMGIENYVDTTRFYVTSSHFMKNNRKKYKHIFMDEAEAIILSFQAEIVQNTLYRIYKAYHDGNCRRENCSLADFEAFKQHSILKLIKFHIEEKISWGELWFMVDTDQALMFLPKHSPAILKTPNMVLNKLIRSTKQICTFFRAVTKKSIPQEYLNFPKAEEEPPIFWVQRKPNIAQSVSEVIVDLCSTKGVKACDICVIPFLQNEYISAEAINAEICLKFVDKAFRPEGLSDVEQFLTDRKPNQFLVAWALRVKGLEFKVVIMVIDEEQFDSADLDDRRKVYIICSRCTCMLVVVGDSDVKNELGLDKLSEDYCFNIKFQYDNNHE